RSEYRKNVHDSIPIKRPQYASECQCVPMDKSTFDVGRPGHSRWQSQLAQSHVGPPRPPLDDGTVSEEGETTRILQRGSRSAFRKILPTGEKRRQRRS